MTQLPEEIAELMEELKQQFNIDLRQRGALQEFHRCIEDRLAEVRDPKTNTCLTLSLSSLKRLCGKDTHKGNFDALTCRKIAIAAGYKDYASYLTTRRQRAQANSDEATGTYTLTVGQQITIRFDDDHYLATEHIGDENFLVIKSKGCLALPGDTLRFFGLFQHIHPETHEISWLLSPEERQELFPDLVAIFDDDPDDDLPGI